MDARILRTLTLMFTVLVLMTAGILVAAVQGSSVGIVLAVIVGTLVLSYAIRHDIRSTYVYRHEIDLRYDGNGPGAGQRGDGARM